MIRYAILLAGNVLAHRTGSDLPATYARKGSATSAMLQSRMGIFGRVVRINEFIGPDGKPYYAIL